MASTQNRPLTRVILLSISGLSTSTSSLGGSLLAMLSSVMCGTSPPDLFTLLVLLSDIVKKGQPFRFSGPIEEGLAHGPQLLNGFLGFGEMPL